MRSIFMVNPRGGSLTSSAYRSYLVRFWQSNEEGCWRASAQCVQTGNTVLFGDVDQLLTFLQSELPVSRQEDAAEAVPAE
jgi:hypothetical protein